MLTHAEFMIYQDPYLNGLEPFLFHCTCVSYRVCQLVLAALYRSFLNLNVLIFAIFLKSDPTIFLRIVVISPRFLFCLNFFQPSFCC